MKNHLLQIDDIRVYFKTGAGDAKAVDGVSFFIDAGETYALVGESGCGKTVTSLSILQLVPKPAGYIAGGSVSFEGRKISTLPPIEMRKIRGNDISMIFQEPMTALNPVFTAGYQIVEALRLHRKMSKSEAKKYCVELLDLVRIPDPAQRFGEYPHQLSGGMRQRVMIAMALACQPKVLIADEPTTALDVTIQSQILELMGSLQSEMGTALLLITHDMGVVRENADRIGVMYAGKLVEEGSQEAIFKSPAHPYTELLLRSIPSRGKRGKKLETIEGIVPEATEYPEGCRFADRCPHVMDRCRDKLPPEVEVAPGHRVSCYLYDEMHSVRKSMQRKDPEALPPPIASEETILEVRDLKVHFPVKKGILQRTVGYVKAVDGVDLTIHKGETLALVGESGCGKTTIGKSIVRLLTPTSGSIKFKGNELVNLSRREMKPFHRAIQIVFQDPFSSLNPRLMVGEIIAEGIEVHRIESSRKKRVEKVKAILPTLGLDPDMIHRYPHEFSGGQRQRIGLARAIALDPDLVICDEATSSLDVSVQAQILNLLKDLQHERELTYLFITHDLGVVEYLADRVSVMYLGRIVEEGKTEEIFDTPRHPYTKALLSAVPQINEETGVKKIKLEGDVPSPINPPPGCHFCPRCRDAKPECSQSYPPITRFTDTHICRCFLY